MQKDMAIPNFGLDLAQRKVLALETGCIHVRCAKQTAVQTVSPAVVRALDAFSETALGLSAHPRATMPADIVEGAQQAAAIAHDNQTFAGKFAEEIVARIGYRFGAPHADPTSAEEVFDF